MFTFRHVMRALALACAVAAITATSAAAARCAEVSADTDRLLAMERYYSSYGRPAPIAPPQTDRGSDVEWPLVGLVAAGGLLLAGAAVHTIRVRRHTAGVAG